MPPISENPSSKNPTPPWNISLKVAIIFRFIWLFGVVGLGKWFVRNFMATGHKYQAKLKAIAFGDYEADPGDIFVCTFSKSGTNWMLQIVTQAIHDGAAEFEHIHQIVPWPETPVPSLTHQISEPRRHEKRAIKTHLEAQWVPQNPQSRYIVVLRDPKDVFVSMYYFWSGVVNGVVDAKFTPDEFFEIFLAGYMGDWAEHTASWWARRDEKNTLLITYAQMKADSEKSIREVCDFLQVDLSPEAFESVLKRSEFQYMKAREAQFCPPIPVLRGSGGTMMRSGKVGRSSELLSPEQQKHLDTEMMSRLKAFNSDFPYQRYFPSR